MTKYYIIAGEASGDLHGSNLIREIKKTDPQAKFKGFGGDKMNAQGCELTYHYKDIAFMGIKEVISNLSIIKKAIRRCKKDILQYNPDILILIDYPGFNFQIAEFAREKGYKVIYYISPQLWAWKEGRIKKIKKNVDKLISIVPFEVNFYKAHQYEVSYVGHPLLDVITDFQPDIDFIAKNNLNKQPIIALLPGSRKQEIEKILPVQARIVQKFPDHQFVIAGTRQFTESWYRQLSGDKNIKVVFDQTYDLLYHAKAGIITSGTAVTEASLFELPLVVCYKTSNLTYWLFKRMAKVKYISLVNLILDAPVLKELIQNDLNPEKLENELKKLLFDTDHINSLKENYQALKQILGGRGASERAARIVTSYISDN